MVLMAITTGFTSERCGGPAGELYLGCRLALFASEPGAEYPRGGINNS
jgi:hypothetical protein